MGDGFNPDVLALDFSGHACKTCARLVRTFGSFGAILPRSRTNPHVNEKRESQCSYETATVIVNRGEFAGGIFVAVADAAEGGHELGLLEPLCAEWRWLDEARKPRARCSSDDCAHRSSDQFVCPGHARPGAPSLEKSRDCSRSPLRSIASPSIGIRAGPRCPAHEGSAVPRPGVSGKPGTVRFGADRGYSRDEVIVTRFPRRSDRIAGK
jgi:hypothetical protein